MVKVRASINIHVSVDKALLLAIIGAGSLLYSPPVPLHLSTSAAMGLHASSQSCAGATSGQYFNQGGHP